MMRRPEHSAWLRNLCAMIAIIALFGFGMTPKAVRAACTGDCDEDSTVTVSEIITMVNIALGNALLADCTAGDANSDGQITVDEILQAVNHALNGCGAPFCGDGTVNAEGEECDPGGTCLGGSDAGKHCTGEDQCAGNGVCIGGSKAETTCDVTDANACPGGTCKKCVVQGGNGCAANCTFETEIVNNLVPGELQVDPNTGSSVLVPGTSGATINDGVLGPIALPFQEGTTQTLAVGKEKDGQIPVIVLAKSVYFPRIDISGLACACVRGVAAKTCGGTLFNIDGTAATDCSDGFTAGAELCPADLPCAYVNGNGGSCSTTAQTCGKDADCPDDETCVLGGNSASGIISCVAGLEGVDLLFTQDSRGSSDPWQCDPNHTDGATCNSANCTQGGASCCDDGVTACSTAGDCPVWTATTGSIPGLCGDPPVLTLSGTGPAGSASLLNTTAIGQVVGSCANYPTFCTDVDPIDIRGTPQTLPLLTGTAGAEMYAVNGTKCTDGQCVDEGAETGNSCTTDADCETLCNCPAGYYSCDRVECSGPITISGDPLGSCEQLTGENPNVSGLGLIGAFTSLTTATINDIVVTDLLKGQ